VEADLAVLAGRGRPTAWAGRPTPADPNPYFQGHTVRPNRNPDAAVEDMDRSRASLRGLPILAHPSWP